MSNDENREKNEEKAAVPVQPIIDMGSTVAPAVESYLTDIETFAEPFDEFLNKAVVNHISLGVYPRPPFG